MPFVRGYSYARPPSTTLLLRSNHLLSTSSFSVVWHQWSVSAHTGIRRSCSPPYASPPRVLEVVSFLRTGGIQGLCDPSRIPNNASCEPPFSLFSYISSKQRAGESVPLCLLRPSSRRAIADARELRRSYGRPYLAPWPLVARANFGNAPLAELRARCLKSQHPGGTRAESRTTGAIYITTIAAAIGKIRRICSTQFNLLPLLAVSFGS